MTPRTPLSRLVSRTLRTVLGACSLALTHLAQAGTITLDLEGNTVYDGWTNLTLSGGYSGVGFPGTGAWGTTGAWTTYNGVGAIGSNTAGSSDALLYKIANGTGGGPYPATDTIYFGGFSGDANVLGGTLGVVDTTVLTGLSTVAFQLEIGEAFGYDLFDHAMPTLTYTTSSGTTTIDATFSSLVNSLYGGQVSMPTGDEDIFRNTWGVQFDLSSLGESILSYEITFSGVQHAQIYSMRLDQTDSSYDSNVFDQAILWNGAGSDNLWSTADNWITGVVPGKDLTLKFDSATPAILDASTSVDTLKITAPDGFAISSINGSKLTIGQGGIDAESSTPAAYAISAPLEFSKFNFINVGDDTDLSLTGGIFAPGFYKTGEGTLRLSGDNIYTGNSYNRLLMQGGAVYISGTNTYTGQGTLEMYLKNTDVTFHGGDNALGSNFFMNLVSLRVVNGAEIVGEQNANVVLGDESGKSDLTVGGLLSNKMNIFNEANGTNTAGAASNATITGGNAAVSKLTVDVASGASYEYWGKLGGAEANQDQLALEKKGSGVQALGGTSTYTGDTTIKGGMLRIDSSTALSASSHLVLDGGVLGLGASNYTASLGTGAGQAAFAGDGGFAAYGAERTVNLGGAGAQVTWSESNFVGDGKKLIFSHVAANNTLVFANLLNLGAQTRTVQVDNGTAATDARFTAAISGAGGFTKTGAGTLESTAQNTYAGDTTVEAGSFVIAGANGSLDGDVAVKGGATFQLTNTAATNNTDRVENDATISLSGGVFNFSVSGNAHYSETIGKLQLASGASTVTTAQAPASYTSVVTFGSLERTAGTTVNFSASTLGTRNNIMFTSAPTLDDGIIGAWATVGSEFATYGGSGVTAYTGYNLNLAQTGWAAANNVKLNTAAGMTTTLNANRVINSLNITGATSGTTGNLLNLGGQQLRIASGGLIASGGSSTRTNVISNGTLTAGDTVDSDAELIASVASSATFISANIVDNGTGDVTFIKTASGTLTLSGNNTYSGGTILNQGTLVLNHAQALGTGRLTLQNTLGGVTLNAGGTEALALATNNAQTWNGDFTFTGTQSLNMGTGLVTLTGDRQVTTTASTLTVGGIEGSYALTKAGAGTLVVNGSSTYTGGTNIVAGTMVAAQNDALGSGTAVVQSGGTLRINSGVTVTNGINLSKGAVLDLNGTAGAVAFQGGTLKGSGTLNQAVTVGGTAGSQLNILAPGNSPGTLNTLGQTWLSGGTYLWEINELGVSGTHMGQDPGWDFVNITGGLDLSALTEGAFEIDITSLTSANVAGELAGFDYLSDYSWTIATASGGILGFDESFFNLNTTHFLNDIEGGSFSLGQSGNSLVLSYTGAVPEPGRALLLLAGMAGICLRRRRR